MGERWPEGVELGDIRGREETELELVRVNGFTLGFGIFRRGSGIAGLWRGCEGKAIGIPMFKSIAIFNPNVFTDSVRGGKVE